MSNPCLDALKLALHDGQDSIIRYDENPNEKPNEMIDKYFIQSLKISDGYKIGINNPLEAKFSPWLNSIIGGRGTGKSTIINFLRILFDRKSNMPDDIQNEFDQFNLVGSRKGLGMLRASTEISATILKNEVIHELSWSQAEDSYSIRHWNNESQKWSSYSTISNIRDFFPIQIFNQKELFSLTNEPNMILEMIDSQFDKSEWSNRKKALEIEWFDLRSKYRKTKHSKDEINNLRMSLLDNKNKIKLYEKSENKEILKHYNLFNNFTNQVNNFNNEMKNYLFSISLLKNNVPVLEHENNLKTILDNTTNDYFESLENALQISSDKFEEIVQVLSSFSPIDESIYQDSTWYKDLIKSKFKYEQMKEVQSKTETYDELRNKRTQILDRFKQIKRDKIANEQIWINIKEIYIEIINHHKSLRAKRVAIINQWNLMSNGSEAKIYLELDPIANEESAEKSFRDIIRKESQFVGSIFSKEDKKGCVYEIIYSPLNERWNKREEIIENIINPKDEIINSYDTRFLNHLQTLKRDFPKDIDQLLIWVPEDQINLFLEKNRKKELITTGSAGERTACMLRLLLNLNDVPLIIDQPEDDLDTKLISDFIVASFKSIKNNRQLIIVTHNPNITVNANSDNIIHMDFHEGQLQIINNDALQCKPLREAVCDVMEGGRDALNKRYYRISKALK